MVFTKKPVDTKQFWSDRLNQARASENIRESVYLTTNEDWKLLDSTHINILKRYIRPTDTVLDAGCGFGRASDLIPGIYTGIDSHEEFIVEARKLYPNRKFIVGDLFNLQLEGTYNWAVCISIKAMVINNLGYDKWEKMQQQLLRITIKGILCLEYGVKDVLSPVTDYSVIKRYKVS